MEFYRAAYQFGYLKIDDLKEATKWGCLNKDEFKEITNTDYEISIQ